MGSGGGWAGGILYRNHTMGQSERTGIRNLPGGCSSVGAGDPADIGCLCFLPGKAGNTRRGKDDKRFHAP